MTTADLTAGAVAESVVFLRFFDDLPDPRQCGKVKYPSPKSCCCAFWLCWRGRIASPTSHASARERDLLRCFGPFADGTPSHDHFGDILASLDATAFQRCFVSWTASLTGVDPDVIATDGKTLRRSYQTKGGSAPIHMVSAFAARQRLVLGQVKVADKCNEITAIPKLLAMMAIEGAIVTINAMGGVGQRFRQATAILIGVGGYRIPQARAV